MNADSSVLTAAARDRLALEARLGRVTAGKFYALPLLTDVTGQPCALRQVRPKRVAVCPRGQRDGVAAHRRGLFVLAEETVRRFKFQRGRDLVEWLGAMDVGDGPDLAYVELEDATLARRQPPDGGRARTPRTPQTV